MLLPDPVVVTFRLLAVMPQVWVIGPAADKVNWPLPVLTPGLSIETPVSDEIVASLPPLLSERFTVPEPPLIITGAPKPPILLEVISDTVAAWIDFVLS